MLGCVRSLLQPTRTCLVAGGSRLLLHLQARRPPSFATPTTFSALSERFLRRRNMSTHTKDRECLPTDVKPKKYFLTLEPNLQTAEFRGNESIILDVKKATKTVQLNVLELQVSSAVVEVKGTSMSASIDYDKEKERVVLQFPNELPVGDGAAVLKLEFSGTLSDKLKGFYRSKYRAVDGSERYMAVTQFEPTDARRAFPCWDEPAAKAVFEVTLAVPPPHYSALKVLSNMPATSDAIDARGYRVVQFRESPIMSTYLVAFVVGEFDSIEDRDRNGVAIRVFTPVGKSEQGRFALDVAKKTLPYYDDYFAVGYPLPKLDLVAVPDFAAGAMENWGLVTYRETALLVDPVASSASTRQWVALVVGHELAHMWFGNLVTMEWWTHLWLNEGFASWIEYLCVDHCFPEWDIWTQFVFSDFGRALELDSLKSSHPVEVEVGKAAEVDEIFDIISYSKGCSIIRMLNSFLGTEVFRNGLRLYLQKFKYANTVTEDLWASLSAAAGVDVKSLMDTWTKQTGYPVLTVSRDAAGKFHVTQQRFLSSGPEPSDQTLWQVPISLVRDGGATSGYILLTTRETVIDPRSLPGFDEASEMKFVKFNAGQSAVYRVCYDKPLLAALCKALDERGAAALPNAADRLGIENDAFALARSGYLPATEALALTASLSAKEENYTVWADLSSNLNDVEECLVANLKDPAVSNAFKRFGVALYAPVGKKVGWDATAGEPHLTAMLRALVIARLGRYGEPATVAEARKRFAVFAADPKGNASALAADLRAAVYATVLAHGGDAEYEAVLKIYREADLHEEKVRCLRALGFAKSAEQLRRTLAFSLSTEVRSQDSVFVIESVAANELGRDFAWEFVREKWDQFYQLFEGGFLLSRLVKGATSLFASEERAKEIEEFFAGKKAQAAERAIKQSVERIRSNAKWLARDGRQVGEWLTAHYGSEKK